MPLDAECASCCRPAPNCLGDAAGPMTQPAARAAGSPPCVREDSHVVVHIYKTRAGRPRHRRRAAAHRPTLVPCRTKRAGGGARQGKRAPALATRHAACALPIRFKSVFVKVRCWRLRASAPIGRPPPPQARTQGEAAVRLFLVSSGAAGKGKRGARAQASACQLAAAQRGSARRVSAPRPAPPPLLTHSPTRSESPPPGG
ncbi:MAG: hypothetical protein J3K34DRAFT_277149 [Monoraphidium minutum]|nr:MAG: hypothetical protein J3K34DRAFT_277149 [Monoraphidium minutum]